MYEDLFTILPEYRRCDMEKLVWKKATFGYIPGHFSVESRDSFACWDEASRKGERNLNKKSPTSLRSRGFQPLQTQLAFGR